MTYSAAVAYLYSLQKHGIKLGLETMAALMGRLGDPQDRYRSLHIGGTNGKGSTAAMTAAMLQAAGYRVGLYTSPHLVEFRERIRVNGAMIPEAEVARLAELVRRAAEGGLSPTFFESTTAMALHYFADAHVDVAVLEVGLGGRFDATNIVRPLACAITTIAMDHEEYLGHTLAAIAYEKAGIIKSNVPVVLGRIDGDAFRSIEDVARERKAPIFRLGSEFSITGTSPRCCYTSRTTRYDNLSPALPGAYQLDNAACAIALTEAAGAPTLMVTEQAVRQGLASVHWEGRLEAIGRDPVLLLDGAHNPGGAAVLAAHLRSIKEADSSTRVILVVGMMRDKDHRGFAAPFAGIADRLILTQIDFPRSALAEDLRREFGDMFPAAWTVTSSSEAVATAKRAAAPHDVVCVTGSLMLIGEVKAALRGCELSPLRG
ncbi:MAG TPA: folylpolyglutamate synthase/dihydrofolate synthase family protein [Nitrospira sp.]|nr:folylpolyglutamate synthase/dihydrofolate synthase family protein [Nitrospira sp.]